MDIKRLQVLSAVVFLGTCYAPCRQGWSLKPGQLVSEDFLEESPFHPHPPWQFFTRSGSSLLLLFTDEFETDFLLRIHFFMQLKIMSLNKKYSSWFFCWCLLWEKPCLKQILQRVLQGSEEWKVLSECFPHLKKNSVGLVYLCDLAWKPWIYLALLVLAAACIFC